MTTLAFDLNDHGRIAGTYIDSGGSAASGASAPARSRRSTPPAVHTRVRGIHDFLLYNGRFTEIRPRGVAGNGSIATDVDDRGRVLGYAL